MYLTLLICVLFGYVYEDSDSLIVDNDSLTICGIHQYNIKVHITNNGKLNVKQWSGAADSFGYLVLDAPTILIQDSSWIYGSALGFRGGYLNSHPWGYGTGGGDAGGVSGGAGGGGAYGGDGGAGGDLYGGLGGTAYGNSTDTIIDIGSGGGAGRLSVVDGIGGNGGAKIYLRGQQITIDSSYIEANGQRGYDGSVEAGGGGAGGGILIRANTTIIHNSTINAQGGNGGDGSYGGGGGAGGGRIKIFYSSMLDTSNIALSVLEGLAGSGSAGNPESGVPGSIYIDYLVNILEKIVTRSRKCVVHPSLTKGIVRISSESVPVLLRVYDVSGAIVKTFILENHTEFIDLGDLNQGAYFLKPASINESIGKVILLK